MRPFEQTNHFIRVISPSCFLRRIYIVTEKYKRKNYLATSSAGAFPKKTSVSPLSSDSCFPVLEVISSPRTLSELHTIAHDLRRWWFNFRPLQRILNQREGRGCNCCILCALQRGATLPSLSLTISFYSTIFKRLSLFQRKVKGTNLEIHVNPKLNIYLMEKNDGHEKIRPARKESCVKCLHANEPLGREINRLPRNMFPFEKYRKRPKSIFKGESGIYRYHI